MAIGKMFGLTGGIFLIAILLHVVPATTEMEYFPGLRRPPTGLSNWPQPQTDDLFNQLSSLIEEQARRRFQQQLAQQQYYQSQHQHGSNQQQKVAIEPGFTYRFPENSVNKDEPIQFAANPSDPRYHEKNVVDLESQDVFKTNLDGTRDVDGRLEEHLVSKPAEDVPYYKLKPPMDVNPKVPANNIREDLKALLDKLQKDGQSNAIVNSGVAGLDKTDVVKKHMTMDDTFGMYVVALIAGISAAVTVGLIALIIGWYTLHKKAKAAADVEYPAYGVTGPNKDISPSGDRRLAQSAQMYHYQHQKQQIIAMENRSSGENPGGLTDVESDDENEEGDYTVYECPGLAPTGEMEVKNPLFLDDTPVTPSTTTTEVQNQQSPLPSQQKQETQKKATAKKPSDTITDDNTKPKSGK